MRVLFAKLVGPEEKPSHVLSGAAPLIIGTEPFDGEPGFSGPQCGEIVAGTVAPQYYMPYVLQGKWRL